MPIVAARGRWSGGTRHPRRTKHTLDVTRSPAVARGFGGIRSRAVPAADASGARPGAVCRTAWLFRLLHDGTAHADRGDRDDHQSAVLGPIRRATHKDDARRSAWDESDGSQSGAAGGEYRHARPPDRRAGLRRVLAWQHAAVGRHLWSAPRDYLD